MNTGGAHDDDSDRGGPFRVVDRVAVAAIRLAIRGYQRFLSPLLGRNCRFQPTCSEYFSAAVTKEGAVRGSLRGLRRICRCHPWSRGGFDPP